MIKTQKKKCQIESELDLLLLKCSDSKDLSYKGLTKGHDKPLKITRESFTCDSESLTTL